MSDTLTIPWPPAPLSESGWRRRIEELATKAESLVGRPCSLEQTAELCMELVGLLWPALGEASTVAATCRASLVIGAPGVIVSSSPGDQWAAIHSQLDQVFEQAQTSPAAAVVQLPQPVLSEVVPSPKPRAPRRPKAVEQEPDTEPAGVIGQDPEPAPAADADELPAAWLDYPEPEQHCPEPLEPPTAEPLPVVITAEPEPPAPAPARALRPLAERTAPRPAAEPAEPLAQSTPAPRRRPAPAPAPSGWFSAAEVAELLEVEPCSVGRWRKEGRLGTEGTGWQQCGRSFYFSPDAVENIDRTRIPSGLDQLVAEVQAP